MTPWPSRVPDRPAVLPEVDGVLTGDQLDSYITIEADGSVVAYYGKIDGGQGAPFGFTSFRPAPDD